MPTKRGIDKIGTYYQWGQHGKKYYYKAGDSISRTQAKTKADKQGKVIKISESYR